MILQLLLLEEITIELTFDLWLKLKLYRKYTDLSEKLDNYDYGKKYLFTTKTLNNTAIIVTINITKQ